MLLSFNPLWLRIGLEVRTIWLNYCHVQLFVRIIGFSCISTKQQKKNNIVKSSDKLMNIHQCRGFKVGWYPVLLPVWDHVKYRQKLLNPTKLAVVKTTSTIGLWNIFHKKLMITSIAEFSHSNRTTASRPSWWDMYSLF
jgi:hypothetical protein